ncbi:MAG: molybdenum cofactor guanylyltransferase [Acidobacteriota bacterium]
MALPPQVGRLPVHGFVLAGGKSTRMGADKARLRFLGRPMVELAVEKLRAFCSEVGIAGNRADLGEFAPVVSETRLATGPGAGIEAGLAASRQPWSIFMPVDAPLVPARLLRRWSEGVLARQGLAVSYLRCAQSQPAFCMVRAECREKLSAGLDQGLCKLEDLLQMAGGGRIWVCDAQDLAEMADRRFAAHWFTNINTPQELVLAERWAQQGGSDYLEG